MENKWISVDEKLPEMEEDVLVYLNGQDSPFAVGYLGPRQKVFIVTPFAIHRIGIVVTHRQPLEPPAPPSK